MQPGKMTRTGDDKDTNDNRRGGLMMRTPAPITTAVSNCSQGGLGVLMADRIDITNDGAHDDTPSPQQQWASGDENDMQPLKPGQYNATPTPSLLHVRGGGFFLIISFVAPHLLAMQARGQYLIVVGS